MTTRGRGGAEAPARPRAPPSAAAPRAPRAARRAPPSAWRAACSARREMGVREGRGAGAADPEAGVRRNSARREVCVGGKGGSGLPEGGCGSARLLALPEVVAQRVQQLGRLVGARAERLRVGGVLGELVLLAARPLGPVVDARVEGVLELLGRRAVRLVRGRGGVTGEQRTSQPAGLLLVVSWAGLARGQVVCAWRVPRARPAAAPPPRRRACA